MGGILFLAVILVSWLVRFLWAEHQAKLAAVGGSPQLKSSMRDQSFSLSIRSRARWLGRPKRGHEGDFESLLRARRFLEASELVAASDHRARATLAIARGGSIVDLLLAARQDLKSADPEWAPLIKSARGVLLRRYSTEPWGFSGTASKPDAIEAALNEAQMLIQRGRLRTALAVYRRLERAYPEADDSHAWRLQSAGLAAVLGRTRVSRELALNVSNSDARPAERRQASVMAHGVGSARGDKRPVTSRRARRSMTKVRKANVKSGELWPSTPQEIADHARGRTVVSDRELDAIAMAAALRGRRSVWVGVMRPDGSGTALGVVACAPHEGVVLLADGRLFEFDELVRHSVWGQRMVVSHPLRATVAGTERPTSFRELPYPRDQRGVVRTDPESLSDLREAARAFPRDALASYIYAEGLIAALREGVYGASVDLVKSHLAVSASRFPGCYWPAVLLTIVSAESVSEPVRQLAALRLEQALGTVSTAELARADALPARRDFHVREANSISLDSNALVRGLEDAAARRDGHDVDTHLQLLGLVLGAQDPELIRAQLIRELTWRNPGDAGIHIPSALAPEGRKDAALALACQSGNAESLEGFVARYPAATYAADENFVRVCVAMHSGDLERIAAAVAEATRIVGSSERMVSALALAVPVLMPRGRDASVSLMAAASGPARTSLGEALMESRPETAIALLRAGARDGNDRPGAALELGLAYARRANEAAGSTRVGLAETALEYLDSARHLSVGLDVWQYAYVDALRHMDAAKAMEHIRGWGDVRRPLVAFALVALISEQLGDEAAAERARSRAANALLLNSAFPLAARLGIRSELTSAFDSVSLTLAKKGAWQFYASGGTLRELPPVPVRGEATVPGRALWRLAAEGHREELAQAMRHAYPPETRTYVRDGAPVVALEALSSQSATTLSALLRESKHPAYLRAAQIALSRGSDIGIDARTLTAWAPGVELEEVAL